MACPAGLAALAVLTGWLGFGGAERPPAPVQPTPAPAVEAGQKRDRSRDYYRKDSLPMDLAQGSGQAAPIPITVPTLRLTDIDLEEARSAFFAAPVKIQTFTTNFTFRISKDFNYADGFTFCVQGNDATQVGGGGGALGYGGIDKSVAVKFDLWDNAGEGPNSTGLSINGANLSGAANSIPLSGGIDLHSGATYAATLAYDGKMLALKLTDVADATKTFSHSFGPVDIPAVVGGPTAYVGFTGGTGGLGAVQDVMAWTWTPASASSSDIVPQYAKGFSTVGLTLNGGAALVYPPKPLPANWEINFGAPSSSSHQNLVELGRLPGQAAAGNDDRFEPLPLDKSATVSTTRCMFTYPERPGERLIFSTWGRKQVFGVPFTVLDPGDGSVRNAVVLHCSQGTIANGLPKAVSVSCNASAKAIHLLSGVGAWAYPHNQKGTVTMIVRLHYADARTEDHPLLNGVHFADFNQVKDVPESRLAFRLGEQQLRYLAVTPQRPDPIERIEFVKGDNGTCPVVMAVTIEKPR